MAFLFYDGWRIFHPVDQVADGEDDVKDADVLISVAGNIMDRFKESKIPRLIVPHGLSRLHEEHARKKAWMGLTEPSNGNRPVRVGYVGNLFAHALDRNTLFRMARHNSELIFDIFGPLSPPSGTKRIVTRVDRGDA